MFTPDDLRVRVSAYHAARNKMNAIKQELTMFAVEELGLPQQIAMKCNVIDYIDGYLRGAVGGIFETKDAA